MSNFTITCPYCRFSKEIPPHRIPDRPVQVTCPRCGGKFSHPVRPGTQPGFSSVSGEADKDQNHGAGPSGSLPTTIPEGTFAEGTPPTRLRAVDALFRDSWEIYLRRIGALMGLYLISIGLFLGSIALFGAIGAMSVPFSPDLGPALVGAGVITGSLVGFFGLFWGIAGLVCAVTDESLGIKGALAKAGERFWSFIWIFSLVGYLITGGFLLFVLPGVLFSIWFAFGQFVLVDEDVKGMDAILKSKGYTRGFFFEVFVRLALIWIASSLLGMVPLAGPLLSILLVPYMMIFTYLIYADLRVGRVEAASSQSGREKVLWLLVGTLGYVIIPAGGLFLFGAGILQSVMQLVTGM